MIGVQDFARRFVFLKPREPITFAGRPYLDAVYAASDSNIVLRCSRQVEKSTFLANMILYQLAMFPGRRICYVAPRANQTRLFSQDRIRRVIEQSEFLYRRLIGKQRRKLRVSDMEFRHGSMLHFRSAFVTADSARGLSIDGLFIDEFQDIAAGSLPVLQEAMSHSQVARTVLAGTPKLVENHLEEAFMNSTANEWTIKCPACARNCLLDLGAIGPSSLICAGCQGAIDSNTGLWVPRNPGATWQGFWINHPMVAWLSYDQILQRRKEYDDVRFKNEVLGLPTALGDHVVTMAQLEACCTSLPLAKNRDQVPPNGRRHLVAGIDWGGGGAAKTAICVGYVDEHKRFIVVHYSTFRGREDPKMVLGNIGQICRSFGVLSIGADSGHGHVNNRLLLDELQLPHPLTSISYSEATSTPQQEGPIHRWTVARTDSIGHVIRRVREKTILFPRFEESSQFLQEIACEVAEFDDQKRTIRYSHPSNTQDDILHATNYALLQAGRIAVYAAHPEIGYGCGY